MDGFSDSLLAVQKDVRLLGEKQLKTIEKLDQLKDELLMEQKRQLEEYFCKHDFVDPLPPIDDSILTGTGGAKRTKRSVLINDMDDMEFVEMNSIGSDGSNNSCRKPRMTVDSHQRFRTSQIQNSAYVSGHTREYTDGRDIEQLDLSTLNPYTLRDCMGVVKTPVFDAVCGIIICSNAILVGIETEFLAQQGSTPKVINNIQLSLNIWYLLELLLRLFSYRSEFFLGNDRRWNMFDAFLVSSAFADLCLANVDMSNWKAARILRVIRLFRIVRTLRIMRSLKYVREFRKMVYSLVSSFQTLVWSMLLVMAVVYTFALWFTQSAAYARDHDENVSKEQVQKVLVYYSSCARTMYTLFGAITAGYSWHVLVDPWLNMDAHVTAAVFLVFIAAAVFGILNIVTSVFVESAMYATKHFQDLLVDARKKDTEMYTYHMKKIFKEIDADGGGTVTFKEMRIFLNDPTSELPQYLEALGINSSDIWVLFKLLDKDGSGVIEIDEFCEGCMRLKGEAKSFDINCMIYESRAMIKYQSEFMNFVEEKFEMLNGQNAQLVMEVDRRNASRFDSIMQRQHRRSREDVSPQPAPPLIPVCGVAKI